MGRRRVERFHGFLCSAKRVFFSAPQRTAEIERFQFGGRRHGLVAFDAAGQPVVIFAGHTFGRPEIEMALAQILPQ